MVNSINKIGTALILMFLYSCKKENTIISKKENLPTIKQQLYNRINSFIDSSNCKDSKVISIRYQMFNKKEFILIYAENIFITDSLFVLNEHNNHILAFYNKEFFEKILKNDNPNSKKMIEKNAQWDLYKNSYTETGLPCFNMYELIDKKLVDVAKTSYYYNNLFANPPMSIPPPPPSKK